MTFTELWKVMLELAGAVGVDPDKYMLSELTLMNKARDMATWRHTLLLYSGSFNQNRQVLRGMFPYYDEVLGIKDQSEVAEAVKWQLTSRS